MMAMLIWTVFQQTSGHVFLTCLQNLLFAILLAVAIKGEELPLPEEWPPFMRNLISACCSKEPSQRPPFKEIEALLRQELNRV
jgi:hypothetical protein